MSSLIKIPRNIFQTWSSKNISPKFKSLTDTWSQLNPNYAYFLYDDDDCNNFIKKYFDHRVYNAYIRLIPGAFKADLWRY
jgi:mannosyltransferase OCH1-like enzyme